MFSKSQKKVKRSFFSLIELLIVIGIMGALTALILPQFNSAEDQAKDGGCDYNNAGTLRYISMFRATNGVYPTGFHTGLSAVGATTTVTEGQGGADANGDGDEDDSAMAEATDSNMLGPSTIGTLGAGSLTSLQKAGIITGAYGADDAIALTADSFVAKVNAVATPADEWQDDGDDLTIKGKVLSSYVETGYDVIPLFVASTINWETAYTGGSTTGTQKVSPVQIALEGKCPWLGDGGFRYYICFFKVDTTGTKAAELIGTACPECGSLAANTF